MSFESLDEVKFDLGSLLQGQTWSTIFKRPKTHLLLVLEVWDVLLTYRKSGTGNILMLLDLTLGRSSKLKRGTSIFKGKKLIIISPRGLGYITNL